MATNLLTRAAILAADLQFEDVPVPEWGGTVRVWALSGLRRARYLAAQFDDAGKLRDADRSDAVLASFSIGDETGEPLFTVEDVEALADKSAAAIARVTEVAQRLSGFRKADVKAAEK